MQYKITKLQALAISQIQETIHDQCVSAGWYTDLETGLRKNRNIGEAIAKIHSELSEALEGYCKNKMDDHLPHRKSIEVEFADAIIRILDISGYLDLDISGAMQEKFLYNQTREDHKIEVRKLDGGKKF